MQYILSFIWSFLLISMLTYVVSSVLAADYSFTDGAIISVFFAILVMLVTAVIPNDPTPEDAHH